MIFTSDIPLPLVSVVIPCYNHGHYLGKAIESVLGQSYSHVEVIVVDDGSSDNTREVAQSYGERVRYVHKQNGGLSAARNTGIAVARGEYLVFLDADDWLYPTALQTNLRYLQQNPSAAFVSGSHDKVYLNTNSKSEVIKIVVGDPYLHLLSKGNYIGVPASVLYRRCVFKEFLFDESLKACEDYDLYLNIARRWPILLHTEKVAAYCMHSTNMSANSMMMLEAALQVLKRQFNNLKTNEELKAYKAGRKFWKAFYYNEFFKQIKSKSGNKNSELVKVLLLNKPHYFLRLFFKNLT